MRMGTAAQNAGQIVMKKPDGTWATYGTLAEAIAAADQNVDVADASAVTQIFVTGTVEPTKPSIVFYTEEYFHRSRRSRSSLIKRAETPLPEICSKSLEAVHSVCSGTDASGNIPWGTYGRWLFSLHQMQEAP